MHLTAPVRPAPQDLAAGLKIGGADAQLVKQQGAYINADSVKPAS